MGHLREGGNIADFWPSHAIGDGHHNQCKSKRQDFETPKYWLWDNRWAHSGGYEIVAGHEVWDRIGEENVVDVLAKGKFSSPSTAFFLFFLPKRWEH
ncbi:MAG: hypothetical protein DMG69_16100 [Acidobacteria bacterium]|nr:MAG: hypothetical protein DMG69_16100 [Acidobacteriota bacterium]